VPIVAAPAAGPPGFIGALTGPMAVLNASAEESFGLAIVTTLIPSSRNVRRRMSSMIASSDDDHEAPQTRVFFTFAAA
jgi:hypothetical protein